MNPIVRTFHQIINFFYPVVCLVCNDKINLDYKNKLNPYIASTEFCCSKCKAKITFAGNKDEVILDIISNYNQDNFAITNAISLFKNTLDLPIINLIYGLKYKGYSRIGLEYGRWLGEILLSEQMSDYDFISPVPIHAAKKRERGYNQSDFIACGVNDILSTKNSFVKIVYDLLHRLKYTSSQTQLSKTERFQNMERVFVLNKKYNVSGKRILLVDDVLTTGATLNNCALILLENEAKQVDVATLLKA